MGLPGSGKTLLACRMLERAKREGKRCFANFSSVRGDWERVRWEEVVRLEDAFVVLDEAHMWFPAREWARQTQDVLGIFQQHRKVGLDLVWIAQHESRVDVALRELTAFLYSCRKVGPVIISLRHEACGKSKVGSEVWLASRYYGAYWTEERVLGRDEVCDDPIVGVKPNYARCVDELGHVRIVKMDGGEIPRGFTVERYYYRSKWSSQIVDFGGWTGGPRPTGPGFRSANGRPRSVTRGR